MKAQELRIGNLVYVNGKPAEVTGINKEGVTTNYLTDFPVLQLTGLEPIPLTEEWLVKFGLKLHDLNKCHWIENEVGKDEGGFQFVLGTHEDDHGHWCYKTKKIEYVHQLQNIFYALKGKELESDK